MYIFHTKFFNVFYNEQIALITKIHQYVYTHVTTNSRKWNGRLKRQKDRLHFPECKWVVHTFIVRYIYTRICY